VTCTTSHQQKEVIVSVQRTRDPFAITKCL